MHVRMCIMATKKWEKKKKLRNATIERSYRKERKRVERPVDIWKHIPWECKPKIKCNTINRQNWRLQDDPTNLSSFFM